MDGIFLREVNAASVTNIPEIPAGNRTFRAIMENDTLPNIRSFTILRCGIDSWTLP